MRRTPSRLFGALTMLWSLVVINEPTRIHPCPTHGGGIVQPVAPSHDMSAMDHAAMAHNDAPAGQSHSDKAHQCQCPGGCCASATLTLDSAPTVVTWTTEAHVALAPFAAPLRVAIARAAHSLPFANGPPAAGLL
jgi:hypothetical protein